MAKLLPCFSMAVLSLGPAIPSLYCQAEKTLSAREIFYSAPAKPGTTAQEPAQSRERPERTRPPATKAKQQTARRKPPPPPKEREEAPAAAEPGPPEVTGAQYVPAAHTATPHAPLGLRYSILSRTEDGRTVEVDAGTAFRAGDRIRLSVEVNDRGYLYIIHRGSSGVWKPLFPSPEIGGGNNLVERGHKYEIPAGYVFTFDEQPGVEKLFIVLSRQPESSLEKLIYSLSRGKPETVAPEKQHKILLAQNLRPIHDSFVAQLRTAYARDLIIEKVDETTPGPKREKAVYVVNPTGTAESRVVADISLIHR